jgi:hypothetical protein
MTPYAYHFVYALPPEGPGLSKGGLSKGLA